MTLRLATRSDLPAVAAVLGRAFHDDPVMCWIFPDDAERTARLTPMCAVLARHEHLPYGATEIAVDDDSAVGTALWDPPGRRQPPWWRRLAAAPALMRSMRRRVGAGAELESVVARARPTEPHWYLSMIGTVPAAMGRGVGTELLRSRLSRCDDDGVPAYLEASDPDRGVPYYKRFGFTVTGEIVVPDGGPTLCAMWRAPR